jgi:hypothetical protein
LEEVTKGIGAEVDVEERALRPFEQDPFPRPASIVHELPHGLGEREDLRRHLVERSAKGRAVHGRQTQAAAKRVMVDEKAVEAEVERLGIGEVGYTDGAAAHLVLVGGADAAACGADLGNARLPLARAVQLAMDREGSGACSRRSSGCRG